MVHFDVIWSAAAERDLRQIIRYIGRENPQNARTVLERIKHKASELVSMPERGRMVPEFETQGIRHYRELVIAPWRLIYRISGKDVLVFCLVDSRRNVEDVLWERATQE